MTAILASTTQQDDLLQIKHFDYIELYVGNAPQAAHFYRTALGFTPVAYAGLETGVRDRMSYVMEQGDIRLLLTSPIDSTGPIAEHVLRHSDSVKDLAFEVKDAAAVFELALRSGARPVSEPTVIEDDYGQIIKATIAAYGDTVHSFVQRTSYAGAYFPNFRPIHNSFPVEPAGLLAIDHVAVGIEPGQLDEWVDFYMRVLSFHELHEEMISTDSSSMKSKVVESDGGLIKFPIVEPVPSRTSKRSQIDEYLAYHHGAGAQHIAFLCDDIVASIRMLQRRGITLLQSTPRTYYELLRERVPDLDPAVIAALRELHILVDNDKWGTLMQIFSKPVQSRPTLFMEFIQRNGARGFGGGNIKALFEAVEREQALRGNI